MRGSPTDFFGRYLLLALPAAVVRMDRLEACLCKTSLLCNPSLHHGSLRRWEPHSCVNHKLSSVREANASLVSPSSFSIKRPYRDLAKLKPRKDCFTA